MVEVKGSRLGKYEILDKLGEGGMGEVWRARDEQLHRTVALKILPPEVSRDPGRRARFEQEARALAALNHPNIVAVYEFGEHEGRVFLVSELVDGESLRTLLDKGRIPLRQAIGIGVQIAEAMAAAHAAGIVHRDLKPENVMLTQAGTVKVLDFGLAKQTVPGPTDATVTALTTPGTVMGTVGYMSPEQVRGLNTDHRSDIFSLGAVLYEMFAGHRAFEAESAVESMNAILHVDPPEPSTGGSPIPSALNSVVMRCLEKRPEQRFQSAADLAFALRSVAGTNAGTTISGAHPVSPAASVLRPAPIQDPPKGRKWPWTALAVLGAAALFAGGFLLRDRTLHLDPPGFQRITFRRGLVSNARFSSDGRSVVYAAYWDSAPAHIFLAMPGDPDSRDLGLPDGSKLLSVSVNGEVAFSHPPFADDETGTLIRGSLSGGQMRPWLEGVYAADWSPDGSSLAIVRKVDGKYRLEYPVGKVLGDSLGYPYAAIRVSPDGKKVAFASYSGGSSLGIGFFDADGKRQWFGPVSGQTTGVTAVLSWSPDGREIWFRSFDPNEAGAIYAIDLKGHKRLVTRLPGHATVFDIARDGRVLLRTDSSQRGILAKGPNDTAERDLSVLDDSLLNGISDDGTLIATSALGEGAGPKGSIYVRKLDGSPPIRVGDGRAFILSPDGKWISGYSSSNGSDRQYKLLPTGAGEERPLQFPGLKLGIVFGWLPGDQQYALVGADSATKSWRCFAADMLHNVVHPVCPPGIPDDLIYSSPDGKWILSQAPGGGHYTAYPVAGGDPRPVPSMAPAESVVGWRADSHSVYVTDIGKGYDIVDLVSGKRTPWMQLHPARADEYYNIHITPDGRAYAYNFVVRTSDLYVASGLR